MTAQDANEIDYQKLIQFNNTDMDMGNNRNIKSDNGVYIPAAVAIETTNPINNNNIINNNSHSGYQSQTQSHVYKEI